MNVPMILYDRAPPRVLLAVDAEGALRFAQRCEIVKLDLGALDGE